MRRSLASLAAPMAALLLAPAALAAQVCTGQPALAGGQANSYLATQLGTRRPTYSVGTTLGMGAHAFGGLAVATTRYEGTYRGTSWSANPSFGMSLGASRLARTRVCPLVAASYTRGPDDVYGPGSEYSAWRVGMGAALGHVVIDRPTFDVTPMAGLFRMLDGSRLVDGDMESRHRTEYWNLQLGVGFTLRDRVTFLSATGLPLNPGVRSLAVSLGVRFGGR